MNKPYTIFNPQTGQILRSGEAPEKMLGIQVRAGESILVGEKLNDLTHRVEMQNGIKKAVPINPAEPIAMVGRNINPALLKRFQEQRLAKTTDGSVYPDHGHR